MAAFFLRVSGRATLVRLLESGRSPALAIEQIESPRCPSTTQESVRAWFRRLGGGMAYQPGVGR